MRSRLAQYHTVCGRCRGRKKTPVVQALWRSRILEERHRALPLYKNNCNSCVQAILLTLKKVTRHAIFIYKLKGELQKPAIEAKDNMKSLATLNGTSRPSPAAVSLAILDTLPTMLNAVRMVWISASTAGDEDGASVGAHSA